MAVEDKIHQVFSALHIEEKDYPEYSNPEEFAGNYKKCSVLESHFVIQTGSTNLNTGKNA